MCPLKYNQTANLPEQWNNIITDNIITLNITVTQA